MAEERNVGTARAPEAGDEDATKAELQRRMEEARESITQTVTEIKETVANQYQAVRDTVTESLDWREQFRRRPVAFSIGALSVGFIVGYNIAGVFGGDGYDERDYAEDEDQRGTSGGILDSYAAPAPPRSYAAQAITGGAYGSSAYASAPASHNVEASASDFSSSRAGSMTAPLETASAAQADEPEGPSLLERFKQTKAYDRLEDEIASLGDRFVDELSRTAQAVVLPALFNKVKDLFGVDLSGHRAGGQQGAAAANTRTASSSGTTSTRPEDPTLSGQASSASSGASYGTSENRGYGGSPQS